MQFCILFHPRWLTSFFLISMLQDSWIPLFCFLIRSRKLAEFTWADIQIQQFYCFVLILRQLRSQNLKLDHDVRIIDTNHLLTTSPLSFFQQEVYKEYFLYLSEFLLILSLFWSSYWKDRIVWIERYFQNRKKNLHYFPSYPGFPWKLDPCLKI
jgi:hypothetical protein